MRPFTRLALLILVAVAALPLSAKQMPTSDTIEATANMLSMPSTDDGILVLKTCPTCKSVTLRATSNTQYILGGKDVSLKDFSAFARMNGNANVTLAYDVPSSRLLRVTGFFLPTPAR